MEGNGSWELVDPDEEKVVELVPPETDTPPSPSQFELYKERVANVMETVAAAFRRGRLMVAIFSIEAGQIHLTRHTHDFPPDDFEAATNLLREDLARELGMADRKAPLPRANVVRPKPMDLMFGRSQKPNSVEE